LIKTEKYKRARKEASRIVERWPKEYMAYNFRALVTCVTSDDWARAAADLDRAIQLEPRYFLSYGLRACLDIMSKKYARALGDITFCALTLDECEFQFTWKIDFVRERFFVGAAWRLKENAREARSANFGFGNRAPVGRARSRTAAGGGIGILSAACRTPRGCHRRRDAAGFG
jgi:hypothetical protein